MNRRKTIFLLVIVLIPIIVASAIAISKIYSNESDKITGASTAEEVTGESIADESTVAVEENIKEVDAEDKSEESEDAKVDESNRYAAVISEVVDGDTVDLSTGETVRLLGINTPEKGQPYYEDATNKLKALVSGKKIMLEADTEDKDKYNRLLRYIFAGDVFVNAVLVEEGLATVYLPEESKYEDEFRDAESKCKRGNVRLCKVSKSECAKCIKLKELHEDAEGNDCKNLNDEYVVFENTCSSNCDLTKWVIKDETNSHIYTIPSFVLNGGTSFTLYTGAGTNSATALYWGRGGACGSIWNNDKDTLFLKDANGDVVIQNTYGGY